MKKTILLLLFVTTFLNAQNTEKEKINKTLDAWHKAAGDVKFDAYFDLMADDAIFIGPAATEPCKKNHCKSWANPYFDKGKTWNFTA